MIDTAEIIANMERETEEAIDTLKQREKDFDTSLKDLPYGEQVTRREARQIKTLQKVTSNL